MSQSVYLLVSEDQFLISEKIDNIVTVNAVSELNILKFDDINIEYDVLMEELQTVSFFGDKKILIVKDAKNLSKLTETRQKELAAFLKTPNRESILVLISNERFANIGLVEKAVNKFVYIEELQNLEKSSFDARIQSIFKELGYDISTFLASELAKRCSNDMVLIQSEITKITTFLGQIKTVDLKTIESLVPVELEENIYELSNAVIGKNIKKSLEIYSDLLFINEDPLKIMNSISSKIIELLKTKKLMTRGKIQKEISENLKISMGQTYFLMKSAGSTSIYDIESSLERLVKLDYQIKSGKIDKTSGLEMFLLGV